MNGFIRKIGGDVIVFEDSTAWRAHAANIDLSRWLPLDPVEIVGPHGEARMTNMRTEETIIVVESAVQPRCT
jgi:hypothetical protein